MYLVSIITRGEGSNFYDITQEQIKPKNADLGSLDSL